MRRGEIAIIVHGEFGRPRPAVAVQADEFGERTTTVLACPITSVVTEQLPIRPVLEATARNGLRRRSQIMTDKMVAVPRGQIRQVIGAIGPGVQDELDRALLLVLGLARRT